MLLANFKKQEKKNCVFAAAAQREIKSGLNNVIRIAGNKSKADWNLNNKGI